MQYIPNTGKLLIFVVNGYARSGKDTFIKFCECMAMMHGYTVRNVSSVDMVKEAAKLLGWDGEKDSKGRKFLSDLKELSTKAYDGPMRYMMSEIQNRFTNKDYAYFFHIREPLEIRKFVEHFPATKTVFIHRADAENHHANPSDTEVTKYSYNHYVLNDGTMNDLRRTAFKFMEELCK